MCWLPADHAVQPGRNTSCIQAAHYAKCPHCVHKTLCPDAGCATVHGQDVFYPQTERTLHIVLSDVDLSTGSLHGSVLPVLLVQPFLEYVVNLSVNVAAHQIINMESDRMLTPMALSVSYTWVIGIEDKSFLLQIPAELVVPE